MHTACSSHAHAVRAQSTMHVQVRTRVRLRVRLRSSPSSTMHVQERLRGWPALLLRAREERAHLAPMLEALDEEDQVGAPP